MAPTHFSIRKFRRKLSQDGYNTTIIDSIETVYRRTFYRYIFQFLSKTERIKILETGDLEEKANRTVNLELESSEQVYTIDSGKIFSDTGLIVTDNGDVVTQSVGSPQFSEQFTIESLAHQDFGRKAITPYFLLSRVKRLPTTRTNKVVCPLIPRYRNYYHWIVGTVPKIRYVEKYQEKTGESVTFLLPHSPPQWIQETISLLGYSTEQFLIAQESTYEPSRIVIPPHPFPGEKGDYRWIRQRVFDSLDIKGNQNSNKRVYISREKAIGRRVVNEDILMETLSDYGFKKYHLEDRTVEENVRLFSSADMIVSPHGAGLTDIIFADDCTVVELFGSRENNAYELLCHNLELDYACVKCEAASTDIRVDIDRIEQILPDKDQNS